MPSQSAAKRVHRVGEEQALPLRRAVHTIKADAGETCQRKDDGPIASLSRQSFFSLRAMQYKSQATGVSYGYDPDGDADWFSRSLKSVRASIQRRPRAPCCLLIWHFDSSGQRLWWRPCGSRNLRWAKSGAVHSWRRRQEIHAFRSRRWLGSR